MAEGAQGAAFTAELRKQVVTGLGHMFGDAESSVWIDFSDHSNVGDSAIWLGQVQVMQELGIEIAAVVPTAACTLAVIEPTLRRFPDATVAIQGGGNFGGLYSNHHQARLAGLQASANRTVVQAPQSVHFVSDAAKDELRQACRAPGRLATAVRDEFSLKRMRDLDPAAILLPDIAHCIAPLTAPPPVKAVQILREQTAKPLPRKRLVFKATATGYAMTACNGWHGAHDRLPTGCRPDDRSLATFPLRYIPASHNAECLAGWPTWLKDRRS